VIRGTTRLAAVLGHPVAHSRSPELLNAAFAARGIDAVMVAIDAAPSDLAVVVAGLAAGGALGASVTVPHKLAVAALCRDLAPEAREIGAVNCLQFTPAGVVGHNTDGGGFVDALGVDPATVGRVVILGAGGSARAVAHGMRGARELQIIARRAPSPPWPAHAEHVPWRAAELARAFARAEVLVDCTPTALDPERERAFLDELPLAALPASARVVGLVYHRTPLLVARAREAGLVGLDGRGMLVHQGARAFAIWIGQPAPVDAMSNALDQALSPDP
jgi:shikimate dehydrogenase